MLNSRQLFKAFSISKFLILSSVIMFMATVSFAHPPKSISFKIDKDKNAIHVEIDHKVKDITTHYIDKVEVFLNDKSIIVLNPSKQTSTLIAVEDINIEKKLIKGDVIVIKANCNKFGSKSKEIIIE